MVEADERHLVLEQRVRLADGADAPVEVLERDVAFGGAVHLDDARDAEALLEGGPDVGTEPGAGGDAEAVVAVVRGRRLAQQVATELADVDEGDGLVPPDVVQEGAGGELPARGEAPRRPGTRARSRRTGSRRGRAAAGRRSVSPSSIPSSWERPIPPIVKRRCRTIAGFG